MAFLCLTTENPTDPHSWSGSALHFFSALENQGMLTSACQVSLSKTAQYLHQLLSFHLDRNTWKEKYNSSIRRFNDMSIAAERATINLGQAGAILQIGARFKTPRISGLPIFGYFDGNAAMRYRHFDKFGISAKRKQMHLQFEREVYESMTGIFVMSEWLKRSFVNDYSIDERKIHVVGAGINFNSLPALPTREFSSKNIIFIGKEFERKGGKFLLEGFNLARERIPELSLTVVGPEKQQTEHSGVNFVGFLSKSDKKQQSTLQSLLDSASMLVLPSEYEPFGISLLEGMANGLPCITVDKCAMPEIVSNDSTGLVVEYGNTQQLASAMCDLAADPEKSRRFGQMGRERIEAEFTWPRIAEKISYILSTQYNIVDRNKSQTSNSAP
jgi:glycosyltransferase involved in cell wall biosynthesis